MLCHLRPQYIFSHSRKSSSPPLLGMVALAIALPPPSVHEIRLEPDMFVTRINFDFKIAHCEPKISDLLDYTAEELVGRNLYTLCHGEDANKLRKCHMDRKFIKCNNLVLLLTVNGVIIFFSVLNKGQVLTHYYRLMNKTGGYTWLQTCATVICNSKNAEEQNIICVNYVISAREYENLILDCCQMDGGMEPIKREEPGNDSGTGSPGSDPSNDGGHNRHGDTKPPKPETPEPRRRVRGGENNTANHANSTNTNGNSLSVEVNATEETTAVPTPTVTPAVSRRGQKRKLKNVEIHEEAPPTILPTPHEPIAIQNPNPILTTPTEPQRHPAIDEQQHTESSVKDLENAMSKHLPSPVNGQQNAANTDFSTDTLLKQQQDKGSTIQWIGHHNHHFHQQTSPMPATALLRQLYANRESVIRATSRTTTSGVYYPGTLQIAFLM